jgi:hypothetical protein
MLVLVAAVIVVGALCLLDLVLTFGVIRRLREHTELLLRERHAPAERPVISLATGEAPAPFTAMTADGTAVAGPSGLRLTGFFAAWCSSCPESVAPFIEYVQANRLAKEDVLTVLLTDDNGPPSYIGRLAEVAQVSVQSDADNLVNKAFAVSGFPAFCLLDADGAVLASGHEPAVLPAAALV